MIYPKNKSQGSEFEACWLEIVGSANNSIRCNIQTPKTKTDTNPKIILKYLKNRLNKICCSVCFAISAENRYGRDAGGGGGGGGGVFRYIRDSVSSLTFLFACFISSSGICYPLNHKGTSCPP